MPGTGVRQRLQPPLPPEYFGNAVQGEFVFMKARDQGLGNVFAEVECLRKRFWVGEGQLLPVRSGPANKVVGKITLFARVEVGSVNVEACF
ncbi:hypothetical protein WN944_012948 [Citrus x changshan-huyou]|uniref:Uncharacterized protein n=1 Tax=Citrus x changshan-huyou TaxID=2935761 RepID=A0AAP0QK93_9ROSI